MRVVIVGRKMLHLSLQLAGKRACLLLSPAIIKEIPFQLLVRGMADWEVLIRGVRADAALARLHVQADLHISASCKCLKPFSRMANHKD